MLLDENEARRFIDWLPSINELEVYVIQVMLRPWREEHKHLLPSSALLHLEVVEGGEGFRERMLLALRRASLLAANSDKLYRVLKAGARRPVPPEATAIYTRLNPSQVHRVFTRLCVEHLEALQAVVKGSRYTLKLFSRIASVLAREVDTRFHVLDIDDKSIINEVEQIVVENLGYLPARIVTAHGEHILIEVKTLDARTAKRWFSETLPKLLETFKGRVEYNRQALEPTPGTLYKGSLVRFKPPEK